MGRVEGDEGTHGLVVANSVVSSLKFEVAKLAIQLLLEVGLRHAHFLPGYEATRSTSPDDSHALFRVKIFFRVEVVHGLVIGDVLAISGVWVVFRHLASHLVINVKIAESDMVVLVL